MYLNFSPWWLGSCSLALVTCTNVIGRSECIYYVTSVQVIDIHLTASPVASCMMALSGLAGRDYPLQQTRCLLLLLRCKCWCTLMLFIVTILNIPAAVCIQCSRTSDSSIITLDDSLTRGPSWWPSSEQQGIFLWAAGDHPLSSRGPSSK